MKILAAALGTLILVSPMPPAKAQPANTAVQILPILSGVNLTETQSVQMQRLRAQARGQIFEIISQQQRQSFFDAMRSGQGIRAAITAANLSDSQRLRVRTVLQDSRQQFAQILTPAQRRQIFNNFRSRWSDQSLLIQ